MNKRETKTDRYISVDEDLYQRLKESAEANYRSIKGQALYILRDFFDRKDRAI